MHHLIWIGISSLVGWTVIRHRPRPRPRWRWLGPTRQHRRRRRTPQPPPPPTTTKTTTNLEPSPSPSSSDLAQQSNVIITGSSVNLPDMSATLQAKVAVSEQAQEDPRLLQIVYDDMATKFSTQGLNVAAVRAMRQYFTGFGYTMDTQQYSTTNSTTEIVEKAPATPLRYIDFPVPLPPGAVRLCLVFFRRANPSLADLVYRAAFEVIDVLRRHGIDHHLNDKNHYHITVYMTSQPHTLRPSPLDASAPHPLPDTITPEQLWEQTKPTDIEGEVGVMRGIAATTPPPTFRVHRLVMADSGTLLLCNTESTSSGPVMTTLRKRLKGGFPGGPPRQSTIYHASVARILCTDQLTPEVIREVQEVCDRWSDRLRGLEFEVEALHYVMEERFTTVEGPAVRLPFASSLEGGDGRSDGVETAEGDEGSEFYRQ